MTDKYGLPVRGAMVNLYQEEGLIGSVQTDNEGNYHTGGEEIDASQDLTLEYKRQDLFPAYRRVSFNNSQVLEQSVSVSVGEISNAEGLDDDSNVALTNPADSTLVRLYGYTLYSDGTPVQGVEITTAWDVEIITDWLHRIKNWQQVFSNTDGYFEILVPKEETVYFRNIYNKYDDNFFFKCQQVFRVNQNEAEFSSSYEDLGPLISDFEVAMDIVDAPNTISATLSGNAFTCDGIALQEAILYCGFTLGGFNNYAFIDSTFEFGLNGSFTISIEMCEVPNFDIDGYTIYINDEVNEVSLSHFKFTDPQVTDLGNLYLCEDRSDYPDSLWINIGGAGEQIIDLGSDSYQSVQNELRISFTLIDGDHRTSYYFGIEDVNTTPALQYFELWKGIKNNNIVEIYEKTIEARIEEGDLDNLTTQIISIEDRWVTGKILGSVPTINGNQSLDIRFKVYDK